MTIRMTIAALILATPALAGLEVEFDEGAPKDRLIVEHTGGCAISDATLTIDFTESEGQLIFDTTAAGAGVEVFQPFEVIAGGDALSAVPNVTDGQKIVTLRISELSEGDVVIVTTDVDDTIGAREITVRDGEFSGSTVRLEQGNSVTEEEFGQSPLASIIVPEC